MNPSAPSSTGEAWPGDPGDPASQSGDPGSPGNAASQPGPAEVDRRDRADSSIVAAIDRVPLGVLFFARFAAALALVTLTAWWVVPRHSFSGPVLFVADADNEHGLHLGDLPAGLYLLSAFWLVWPLARFETSGRRIVDASRMVGVAVLLGAALWWVIPQHGFSGPVVIEFPGSHGVHLLDGLVPIFLLTALVVGWPWRHELVAGGLIGVALWWTAGDHAAFSGPELFRVGSRAFRRGDLAAILFLGLAAMTLHAQRRAWCSFVRMQPPPVSDS